MADHKIRTARKALGMSAGDLARVSGVSVATIYAIEQGRSVGSVRTMYALAPVLNVPIADLVDFVVELSRSTSP